MAQSIRNLALGAKIKDAKGKIFTVIAHDHYASNEVTLMGGFAVQMPMLGDDFANSDVLYFLNNDYLSSLDAKLKGVIKTTEVPYRHWTSRTAYQDKTVNTKVFIPSLEEAGIKLSTPSTKEKQMEYLKNYGNTLCSFSWTRTSSMDFYGRKYYHLDLDSSNKAVLVSPDTSVSVYPIFNLDASVLVTDNPNYGYYNFVFNQPPVINNISNITGVYGGTTKINYTATDSDDTNLTHYISFNNGSTFTQIYPTKSGNNYSYSHVFNQLGTYTCRVKVVDSAGNTATSNGFTVTVAGVAPTVNIVSVVDNKTIEFKVNCATHDISKVEIFVNNSVVETYTSGFNSNLIYEVDKSILNQGKNPIQIKVTSTGNMTGYKDLEANKTTYNLPSAGTKVLIGGNTYGIENASMNGLNHIYTLDKNLLTPVSKGQEIRIVQDSVKVLCSLSNTESHKDFKEMKLVKTKVLKGQLDGYIEEKYELEGEGRYSAIKLETERFITSIASEIIELQQYFDYMED